MLPVNHSQLDKNNDCFSLCNLRAVTRRHKAWAWSKWDWPRATRLFESILFYSIMLYMLMVNNRGWIAESKLLSSTDTVVEFRLVKLREWVWVGFYCDVNISTSEDQHTVPPTLTYIEIRLQPSKDWKHLPFKSGYFKLFSPQCRIHNLVLGPRLMKSHCLCSQKEAKEKEKKGLYPTYLKGLNRINEVLIQMDVG